METGQTIEEILNTIIPPREFHLQSKGQVWVQTAMSVPATRNEVVQLQEELNKRLKQRQANDTGICPIREELYAQCFDELIRQIIISFKKRGLLLACVRDQINMTISSYKKLYESSIAFGIRKSIQADKYKGEMNNKIKDLDEECMELKREVDELREKIQVTRALGDEKRKEAEDNHSESILKIKKENSVLREDLETRLSGNVKIGK